ncbi:zinc finger protein Xfin-like [Physella acuta]|uniref:zinc finger protein Xfin-like n=1 Tax=Physella acuta TaxID=109671 RepID=UPI0027DDCF54|nr:zinc finger protein Xfin-like [Physella acuta]XP_059162491.1 zinc finger protein Xfin-like [Physella acuta]XP_059162492.1 zinc finger protein Xfin-like [Physella acuta]
MEKLTRESVSGSSKHTSSPFAVPTCSGDSSHLVPEFSRKLSIADEPEETTLTSSSGATAGNPHCQEEMKTQVDNIDSVSESKKLTPDPAGEHRFTCPCGEVFERSVQLASHKRWSCKLKEKTAQCDVCGSWFASELGLKRHMKHVHGGAVSCDVCHLRIPNTIKLTRHVMEAHHVDTKPSSLKCYVCGDTNFESKFELECHLVVHKYEKHHQKMTQSKSWTTEHASHFSPYPAPFMRPPMHFPPRPPWPFCHFPPSPMPHFMHHPLFHHSPFHPQPFHHLQPDSCLFAQPTTPTQPSDLSDAPPKVDAHSQVSFPIDQDLLSQSEQSSIPPSHPRHDHKYVEPTSVPLLAYSHPMKHHHGHHGKIKWKKYLRLMMKGKVPPLWMGDMQPNFDPQEVETPPIGAKTDTCEFQMACKFCDKIIQRNKVNWHQRKECPVLSVHRCSVCDRVFRKRHFLIRHMHEQKHYQFAGEVTKGAGAGSQLDANTLSVLQEKMNASLTLVPKQENTQMAQQEDSTMAENLPKDSQIAQNLPEDLKMAQDSPEDLKMADNLPEDSQMAQILASNSEQSLVDKESIMEGVSSYPNAPEDTQTPEKVLNTTLVSQHQCSICKHTCQDRDKLREHLKDHINQVITIQKVHEWTIKSSEYFFLTDPDDELDRDTATSVTASTSCVDSELTSTTGSTMPDSHFSSLDSAISSDPKWTKPHKKKSNHHHRGEIHVCDFCGEQFSFRKDLHFHMENKHKDSTLKCPVCKKKFSWKKRGKFYERHLNSHYGVKVFKHKCDTCDKTFLENSKLRAHMSLHNQELLHRCSICKKGYANKSSLVRHERRHTGIKPYQCEICAESFMEKRELLRHSTTHTGVAPFSCEQCGQGFTLKTSLMSHMKKKHLTVVPHLV